MAEPIGVLLMGYGTPDTLADVEAYYTDIRRGRAPSPEQLANLVARYEQVGGVTPLRAITFAQGEALEARLRSAGMDARVYVGMRHWHPFIAETVARMAADGITRAVGIVLAPHYSRMSIGAYQEKAGAAREASAPGMELRYVDRWGQAPALLDGLAERVLDALGDWSPDETQVLFTAHSLPERIRTWDDPYEREVRATAEALARRLALPKWDVAWQSAGATPDPWIGPALESTIARCAETEGVRNVLVCPVGFTSDHLEILYDLDIEASALAGRHGLGFRRTRSLNAGTALVEAMATEIEAALA